MALFNIGGLGSGLDTNGIIDALVSVKSYRLNLYTKERLDLTYKQEAYQKVNVSLLGLQGYASQLTDRSVFKAFGAVSTNESVAKVTAGSAASAAVYNLSVNRLASATTVNSNIFRRSTGTVSSGGGINLASDFATAGFASAPTVDGTVTFKMNDGRFSTFNITDYATVGDFIDAVNADGNIDIRLDYVSALDGFRIRSESTQNFELSETGATGFFTASSMFPKAVSSSEVSSAGTLDTTKSFAAAGFDKAVDGTVTINGKTFDPLSHASVDDFINTVNADSDAGVTMSYDPGADAFTIESDDPGKIFTLAETGTNGFLTAARISSRYGLAPDPAKTMDSQASLFMEPVSDSVFRINGVEFSVDTSVDAITDILREINTSTAGVSAIYDYSSRTFNFTSKTEGDASIAFTQVSGNFLSAIGVHDTADPGAGVESRGSNAEFVLNGTTMSRSSNSFEFNNLNFTLKETGSTQVSVSQDLSSATELISGFIDKYNEALDYLDSVINEESVRDPKTEDQRRLGMLNSDSLLVALDSALQSAVASMVYKFDKDSGTYKSIGSLEALGISSGGSVEQTISGHLSFDRVKFQAALLKDPDMVADLFAKDYVSVYDEVPSGTKDGSNKTFQLANTDVSYETDKTIQVLLNGNALARIVDRSRVLAPGEFRIEYSTGKLELGDAPTGADDFKVNYAYNISTGNKMGAIAKINEILDGYTQINTGTIDSTVKSLQNDYRDLSNRIKIEEIKLESYRELQLSIFTNLETAISDMNGQADYFAAQMGILYKK